MIDYFKIGQRIRKFRKEQGLSQEELAERIDISVTHMSHIETGNTKLSLPVLMDLATALKVRADDLLYDPRDPAPCQTIQELHRLLEQSTPGQAKILLEILRGAKSAMDKHL